MKTLLQFVWNLTLLTAFLLSAVSFMKEGGWHWIGAAAALYCAYRRYSNIEKLVS